jgi:hypothetical protein
VVDPALVNVVETLSLVFGAVLFVAVIAQVGLSYLGQRNLNDLHTQGLQAIIATNDIETVDREMDDYRVVHETHHRPPEEGR